MKIIQKRFAIALLAGLPMLCGCWGMDAPEPSLPSSYTFPGDGSGGYVESRLTNLNIDSASLMNDSTMLFWSSFHFVRDTTLYVRQYEFLWYELKETSPGYFVSAGSSVRSKTWNVNDTVNFSASKLKPITISLKFPMDSLKANTFYSFYYWGNYTTKDVKYGMLTGKNLIKRTP